MKNPGLSVVRWLWVKLGKEPAAIRGWTWTILLWVCLLSAFNLFMLLVFSKQPFIHFVLILGVGWWLLRKLNKTKRAGKPLDYTRKR